MKIEYTDYAEVKIKKRELSKVQIESVLKSPDKLTEGSEGRRIAQKTIGKYILRVVFEQNGNAYKVITAYYSKSERYK